MIFFLAQLPSGAIEIRAAMEDEGMIGDFVHTVEPGESFGPMTFDELKKLGDGEHEIPIDFPED